MNSILVIAESDHDIRIASAIAFGILYFDYTLTYSAEVERFWKGRFSFASFIFYFNRYLALFGHIPVLYEFYGTHNQEWAVSQAWHQPSGDKTMAGIPGVGCDLTMTEAQGKYLSFVWASVLAWDTTVFALTVYRVLGSGSRWRGSLMGVLLRDGAFYFAVLLVCHMCNILTCLLAQAVTRGISVTITNVIASSLITRLMLNLRDPRLLRNQSSGATELSDLPWRANTGPHGSSAKSTGVSSYGTSSEGGSSGP
ncbi:hypothetical protein DICSQDRAFT_175407 [Dichomitus squalens LYAD-421 SS1]|uniref:DUF6533 domain-containing protein n=1 Tax=Dichomitus squalens (strain LYAD-421) TaxID=732165 RepID=R7SLG2_DICSQ|nr:uncharacterized protein DICSQDRAFT_175407 [Dichomitus squalens LYAD-421 SS1]EJF55882.1 hypothetical protein DICSQDRAFT_175407 [Dichomitus squalens LYAD-421 SS1]